MFGKCTYHHDSSKYEGEWNDGKPEGKGTKTWANGRSYEGEFFGGKPVGKGSKIARDGTKTTGYWVGGKFFLGEPQEGILERQMEELKNAKKLYDQE